MDKGATALSWLNNEREGWLVDFVRDRESAMTFRLCVPNQEVEQIKDDLRTLLSEDDAYQWHQRPLAASRRGIVREMEEQDEGEHAKLYPWRGLFG